MGLSKPVIGLLYLYHFASRYLEMGTIDILLAFIGLVHYSGRYVSRVLTLRSLNSAHKINSHNFPKQH